MGSTDNTTDLTRGIYRRVYSGWLRGRRINTVSTGAALAFLHLYLLADDFGNLPASPETLRADAFPLRRVTVGQMAGWLRELSDTTYADGTAAPLIRTYTVKGELFIHIESFMENQPAGKNGRRVQRYPLDECGHTRKNQDSPPAGILNCPLQSVPPHSDTHTHTHNHTHTEGGESESARLPVASDFPQNPQNGLSGHFNNLELWRCIDSYPKRVKRGKALRAVDAALLRLIQRGQAEPVAWLEGRVQAFALAMAGNPRRFIPDPHNWLDNEQYDDDETTWTSGGDGDGPTTAVAKGGF